MNIFGFVFAFGVPALMIAGLIIQELHERGII